MLYFFYMWYFFFSIGLFLSLCIHSKVLAQLFSERQLSGDTRWETDREGNNNTEYITKDASACVNLNLFIVLTAVEF